MADRNDGGEDVFRNDVLGEADPADVAEQRQSVDPDASSDVGGEENGELTAEAEPADVLEQQRPVGGEEDYPRG